MTTPVNDRQGIQADQPVPPWERLGCFRLDCEPHRGRLLSRLSFACVGISIAFAPIALPLSLTIWRMARRDLTQMRRGVRDPTGEQLTTVAVNGAGVGVALSVVLGLPLWLLAAILDAFF